MLNIYIDQNLIFALYLVFDYTNKQLFYLKGRDKQRKHRLS